MAIKKGDNVIVRAGKDRGKQAKVLSVMPKASKAVVDGLNMMKKHQKARKEGKKGEVISRAMPIRLSSLALWCPVCAKGVRVKAKMNGEKKLRVCVNCATEI